MSSNVHVNPTSVSSYGGQAQEIFGYIRTELEGLANDVTAVPYYGANATDFKTKCGETASQFATALTGDMRSIADAVQASTSNIAQSLGGSAITIEFNGGNVEVPTIPADDGTVGADPAALDKLKETVSSRFTTIGEQLSKNLSSLSATDWKGNAKEQAIQQVSKFTESGKEKIEETSKEITGYIDAQLEAIKTADA